MCLHEQALSKKYSHHPVSRKAGILSGSTTVRLFLLCCLSLLITLTFLAFAPQDAHAQTHGDTKTVKVGYVLVPNFQEGSDGEYKTGEGYEYLQNIAGYADWKYEYVYGSFNELLQKLENGEIDLMGNLSRTEDCAEKISFGSYEQGKESFYLFTAGKNSGIKSSDYNTINGKRVGITANSYQEQLWKKWCDNNNVTCEIIEYAIADERQVALNTGEVDAVIGSTAHGDSAASENWHTIFKVGDAPYFFGVNKSRPDLLQDLNEAQGHILSENPFYNEELSLRYSQSASLTTKQLDDDEIDWLNKHDGLIRVGCLDNYLPLSDQDESGEMKGVVADLVSEIADSYKDENVHFEIVAYHDTSQMMDDLRNGVIDLAPTYGDYWNADRENFSLTSSFMSTTMLMLNEGSYSPENIKRVGYDRQSPLQTVYAAIHSSEYEWVEYGSMSDAALALHRGQIDGALCTACSYHVFAKKDEIMKNLNRVTLPGKVNIAMAVSKQNPELRSFMNRGISVVGEARIFNSLALNSNVDKKATISDLIIQNPGLAALSLLGVVLVVAIVAYYLRRAIKKSRTDSMTGLLNKAALQNRINTHMKDGGVLLVIDIDNFKAINDRLGHAIGDQVIAHLARTMKDTFRTTDILGRFGGDEFMAFMPGRNFSDKTIAKKAEQLRTRFEDCEAVKNNPEIECSVSVGAVRVAPNEQISLSEAFEKADTALYEVKKNGKASFVIAE